MFWPLATVPGRAARYDREVPELDTGTSVVYLRSSSARCHERSFPYTTLGWSLMWNWPCWAEQWVGSKVGSRFVWPSCAKTKFHNGKNGCLGLCWLGLGIYLERGEPLPKPPFCKSTSWPYTSEWLKCLMMIQRRVCLANHSHGFSGNRQDSRSRIKGLFVTTLLVHVGELSVNCVMCHVGLHVRPSNRMRGLCVCVFAYICFSNVQDEWTHCGPEEIICAIVCVLLHRPLDIRSPQRAELYASSNWLGNFEGLCPHGLPMPRVLLWCSPGLRPWMMIPRTRTETEGRRHKSLLQGRKSEWMGGGRGPTWTPTRVSIHWPQKHHLPETKDLSTISQLLWPNSCLSWQFWNLCPIPIVSVVAV